MILETKNAFLAAHRSFAEPRTLLVDDLAIEGEKGVARLSQLGLAPEELWALRAVGRMNLVVLSAPRSAREMYRVLSLAERLVSPGGKILLLPVTDSASEEVRPETTEVFCGIYPEWSRRQIEGNVVELWRVEKPAKKRYEEAVAEGRDPYPNIAAAEKRVAARSEMKFETLEPPPKEVLDRLQEQLAKVQVKSEWSPAIFGKTLGKHVVSLSIFGDHRFGTDFWKQMPDFVTNYVLAHHTIFPGYELRIHHDEHLYHANGGDVLHGLARRGLVNLIYTPSRPKCWAMLHRLLPAWDPTVEYVICRDVDSLPTWRDRQCVEEFVASRHNVGVIHDNWEHGGMMGGLSHFKAEALRSQWSSFDDFIAEAGRADSAWEEHGQDQVWLNETVHRLGRVLEHSIRSRNVTTIAGSDFRNAIATPDKDATQSVSQAAREYSDTFTNYMGSSGYRLQPARDFYMKHSPIAVIVRDAEVLAGGAQ